MYETKKKEDRDFMLLSGIIKTHQLCLRFYFSAQFFFWVLFSSSVDKSHVFHFTLNGTKPTTHLLSNVTFKWEKFIKILHVRLGSFPQEYCLFSSLCIYVFFTPISLTAAALLSYSSDTISQFKQHTSLGSLSLILLVPADPALLWEVHKTHLGL